MNELHKATCDECESVLSIDPATSTVIHGEKSEELFYLHDLGLTYECPVCGYESSLVLDSL